MMYFLCRAVNVMSPYYDGFSIDIYRYANDKCILGITRDKQPGTNTYMGSFMTFKVRASNENLALGIERVCVTAVSEQTLELVSGLRSTVWSMPCAKAS